jgi:hypothetical protein
MSQLVAVALMKIVRSAQVAKASENLLQVAHDQPGDWDASIHRPLACVCRHRLKAPADGVAH